MTKKLKAISIQWETDVNFPNNDKPQTKDL